MDPFNACPGMFGEMTVIIKAERVQSVLIRSIFLGNLCTTEELWLLVDKSLRLRDILGVVQWTRMMGGSVESEWKE